MADSVICCRLNLIPEYISVDVPFDTAQASFNAGANVWCSKIMLTATEADCFRKSFIHGGIGAANQMLISIEPTTQVRTERHCPILLYKKGRRFLSARINVVI